MTIGTRQRLRLRLGMLVGQVALLVSFPGFLCVASSSPIPREGGEEQSAAKADDSVPTLQRQSDHRESNHRNGQECEHDPRYGHEPECHQQGIGRPTEIAGKTESLQTLNGTIQTQSLILPRIQIGPLAR